MNEEILTKLRMFIDSLRTPRGQWFPSYTGLDPIRIALGRYERLIRKSDQDVVGVYRGTGRLPFNASPTSYSYQVLTALMDGKTPQQARAELIEKLS